MQKYRVCNTKLLYKYKHWFPSQSLILCLNNYPRNVTKYKIKGTSKIPISILFSRVCHIALRGGGIPLPGGRDENWKFCWGIFFIRCWESQEK